MIRPIEHKPESKIYLGQSKPVCSSRFSDSQAARYDFCLPGSLQFPYHPTIFWWYGSFRDLALGTTGERGKV